MEEGSCRPGHQASTGHVLTCTKSLPLPWPSSSCRPTCTSKDGPFQRMYRSYQDKQRPVLLTVPSRPHSLPTPLLPGREPIITHVWQRPTTHQALHWALGGPSHPCNNPGGRDGLLCLTGEENRLQSHKVTWLGSGRARTEAVLFPPSLPSWWRRRSGPTQP